MKRTASATWLGDLKQGSGSLSTQSSTLKNTPYSFSSRFENEQGTNPEELIAAAHAGCFTMQLCAFLNKAGFKPEKLVTEATLTIEQEGGGWKVTSIYLDLVGNVPGIELQMFEEIAGNAKENCPISKLLNAMISVGAKLE
ncbi:MAG: OsmC family protein [Proteobacteria bacterium]|nr:OsmC family protein [Pseudomonadota bacterium]